MKLGWNKRLTTALLGVAGFLGMLAPASAVIVTTNYDPSFGAGPLSGYGWRATINYEVPSECFNQTGNKINISLFGLVLGCKARPWVPIVDQIEVLSAQAGIYANSDPDTLLDVLTFDPASLPLSLVHVTLPSALDYIVSWSLLDGNNHSDEIYGSKNFNDEIKFRLLLNGPTALLQYKCDTVLTDCSGWTTAPAPTETTFKKQDGLTFEQVFELTELRVPEPGSAALVLLALGAGLATTRRR